LFNCFWHYKSFPFHTVISHSPHLVIVSYFSFFAISFYFYGANVKVNVNVTHFSFSSFFTLSNTNQYTDLDRPQAEYRHAIVSCDKQIYLIHLSQNYRHSHSHHIKSNTHSIPSCISGSDSSWAKLRITACSDALHAAAKNSVKHRSNKHLLLERNSRVDIKLAAEILWFPW